MTARISGLCLALALALCGTSRGPAAEADPLARLDQALTAVTTFQYGKDGAPLLLAEQIVIENSRDPTRRAEVEARLVRVLNSSATSDGKEFICRQLFTVGTARCVPALAAILTDPRLAHVARLALGRNEAPEAAEALRGALSKTSGPLQVGILNTLGLRRYDKALRDIEKLLSSPDPMVAAAAAAALGEMGGAGAVKALETAWSKATPDLRARLDAALLVSADGFLSSGQNAPAGTIYERLYAPDQPVRVRIAALRGLVAARHEKALPLLIAAIQSPDSGLRAEAISFSAGLPGPAAAKALAELVPTLPPDSQERLLNALGPRADPAVLPAVLAATKSESPAVQAAACLALGILGDASSVDLLAGLAATSSSETQVAARGGLVRLERGEVNAALVRLLTGGDQKVEIEAIRALAGRRAVGAFPDLRKEANAAEPTVRREALKALGALADERTLSDLIALAVGFRDAADLAAAEAAVLAAFQRIPDPRKQAAPVLTALGAAPIDARPSLLRLLGATATPEALAALRAALKNPNPAVTEAAVRALAEWPDAAPAEDLLEVARTAPVPTYKVVALRGYVRMAALGKDPGAMYGRALELATRTEDKKLVIGSLGAAEPTQALRLVEPYLKDDQLQAEAALAVVQIADRLRSTDPARAKAAVKAVQAATADPRLRDQAQAVVNQIEAFEDHILQWQGAGPYQAPNKDAHALFDTVFPPEQSDAGNVKWTRLTKGLGSWDVNLAEALGGGDNVVGYVRTRVWSPATQDARLELGSDDGIKVWLNGTVVHANNIERGPAPRQDLVPVKLQEGWNTLLLKVTNAGGGWAVACRLRKPDDTALEGLRIENGT